jgi:hypothetical protein
LTIILDVLQEFKNRCNWATEITHADGLQMTREKINKQGAIQFEMNAAQLPRALWPHFQEFMDKMLIRGPNRTGITVNGEVVVTPWDEDSTKKKWFLSRDLFALPYVPMVELTHKFCDGSLFGSLLENRTTPMPGFETKRNSGTSAWEIFRATVELYRQRLTLKVWMYWLGRKFELSDGEGVELT